MNIVKLEVFQCTAALYLSRELARKKWRWRKPHIPANHSVLLTYLLGAICQKTRGSAWKFFSNQLCTY
jgi:hypothetical protein